MLTGEANRLKSLIKAGMKYPDGSAVLDEDKIDIIKMFSSIMPRIQSEKITDSGEIKKFSQLDFSISNEQILNVLKQNKVKV